MIKAYILIVVDPAHTRQVAEEIKRIPQGVEAHQGPERVPLDPELPGFVLETRGLFLP